MLVLGFLKLGGFLKKVHSTLGVHRTFGSAELRFLDRFGGSAEPPPRFGRTTEPYPKSDFRENIIHYGLRLLCDMRTYMHVHNQRRLDTYISTRT